MNKKYKIGFVILHYLAKEMTCCCVDALTALFPESSIVVVDNNSPDNSGGCIREKYTENQKIDVILSDQNVGFAQGNNIGYKFLKQQGIDFIVIMNNDVIITDKCFIDKIVLEYEQEHYFVLGPNIISIATNNQQNPAREKPLSNVELEALKKHHYLRYYLHPLFYVKQLIWGAKKNKVSFDRNRKRYNVVLFGACLIFSPDFVEIRENVFNPQTFMFYEEDILFEECIQNRYKMIYSPQLSVYHFEDVSTNASTKSSYKKIKFKAKHEKDSFSVLYRLRTTKGIAR